MKRTSLKQLSHIDPIVGRNISLIFNRLIRKTESLGQVPAYLFNITLPDETPIGQIDLRLGINESLVMYGGQIGYGIDKPYRGHGYAAQACELLRGLALDFGFEQLWVTCNPDNIASIKTCERLGATLVDQVDVPEGSELWYRGDRVKLRFLWVL